MADGAVLHESGRDWSRFTLTQHPGAEATRLTARPIDPLREACFIERVGTLPERADRWFEADWRVTEHGLAWLAANESASRVTAHV